MTGADIGRHRRRDGNVLAAVRPYEHTPMERT